MTRKPPPRFLAPGEMTPAQHLQRLRTGKPVENPAYARARRAALADAGFESDEDAAAEETPLEDWTPADHSAAIRRNDH